MINEINPAYYIVLYFIVFLILSPSHVKAEENPDKIEYEIIAQGQPGYYIDPFGVPLDIVMAGRYEEFEKEAFKIVRKDGEYFLASQNFIPLLRNEIELPHK